MYLLACCDSQKLRLRLRFQVAGCLLKVAFVKLYSRTPPAFSSNRVFITYFSEPESHKVICWRRQHEKKETLVQENVKFLLHVRNGIDGLQSGVEPVEPVRGVPSDTRTVLHQGHADPVILDIQTVQNVHHELFGPFKVAGAANTSRRIQDEHNIRSTSTRCCQRKNKRTSMQFTELLATHRRQVLRLATFNGFSES